MEKVYESLFTAVNAIVNEEGRTANAKIESLRVAICQGGAVANMAELASMLAEIPELD